MPTIEFVEVAAEDLQRARAFYQKLFGWTFERMPGPMEYWIAQTTGGDGKPAVHVGMMARRSPQQRITAYVTVESIDASMEEVRRLGGQVLMPKMAVPKMGWFAVCMDTEQNGFALWQTDEKAG